MVLEMVVVATGGDVFDFLYFYDCWRWGMAIDDVGNIFLVVSKKVDGGRGGLVAGCGGG